VRTAFVPDFKLTWSGWTAFRATFDASLTMPIPNLPEDSVHWWGPKSSFFSSKLGRNLYTVVGSVYGDPDDPNAEYREAAWDEEADVKILRELFTVSLLCFPLVK
jgi:salicylate hydroxylase